MRRLKKAQIHCVGTYICCAYASQLRAREDLFSSAEFLGMELYLRLWVPTK